MQYIKRMRFLAITESVAVVDVVLFSLRLVFSTPIPDSMPNIGNRIKYVLCACLSEIKSHKMFGQSLRLCVSVDAISSVWAINAMPPQKHHSTQSMHGRKKYAMTMIEIASDNNRNNCISHLGITMGWRCVCVCVCTVHCPLCRITVK